MPHTVSVEDVLRGVEELGLFQAPRRIEPEIEGAAALEGEVCVEGRSVTLTLVLAPGSPLDLPQFFLRPWNALGFIPHVDQRGLICFTATEGLVVDRRRPVQVVQEGFHRAMHVLEDGVTGRNQADFTDEFEVYWGYLPEGDVARSLLDPADDLKRVVIALRKDKPPLIASAECDISAFYNGVQVGGAFTLQYGLYLPLEPDTLIVPPLPNGPFWTAEEARRLLLGGLSESNRRRLKKLARGRTRAREYVIVKLPRPSGGATLFGIRYEQVSSRHPLLEGGLAKRLTPLQLQRLDRGFLIQRGGGDADLGRKRVLVVGCGAIGGHLAFELARAGVLDLTVVDLDKLIPENSFRHVLGRRYWWKRKAEALKEEIETQLPYVRVGAIVNSIEAAVSEGSVDLGDYDLVALATGNPTAELEINERLQALAAGPAGVFTWLEPLGIGGHALLTANAPGGGCFECLYTPTDDTDEGLENRAAFAASGQSFGRALSGCGSLYTPFGSMDAVRTAVLAARLAVDALTGKEQGNPLLSWRGDAAEFESEGFRLSHRYRATEDELNRHRYTYRSARCRVCGARKGE